MLRSVVRGVGFILEGHMDEPLPRPYVGFLFRCYSEALSVGRRLTPAEEAETKTGFCLR